MSRSPTWFGFTLNGSRRARKSQTHTHSLSLSLSLTHTHSATPSSRLLTSSHSFPLQGRDAPLDRVILQPHLHLRRAQVCCAFFIYAAQANKPFAHSTHKELCRHHSLCVFIKCTQCYRGLEGLRRLFSSQKTNNLGTRAIHFDIPHTESPCQQPWHSCAPWPVSVSPSPRGRPTWPRASTWGCTRCDSSGWSHLLFFVSDFLKIVIASLYTCRFIIIIFISWTCYGNDCQARLLLIVDN